jgi:predicted GTPase
VEKKGLLLRIFLGTTRDTVEAGLYKNGNYWTLIDTAGIGKRMILLNSKV